MSYNPQTGLVYIPAIELAGIYSDKGIDLKKWRSPDLVFDPGVRSFDGDAPPDAGTSSLKAWDPVAQRLVWERPLPGAWNAGTLTTAGNLVFQGRADGEFVAYRASTGDEVWKMNLGLGISASPVTYSVNGRQYVALAVGWGGAGAGLLGSLAAKHGWTYRAQTRRLVAFALDARTMLPAMAPPAAITPIVPPGFVVDASLGSRGGAIYRDHCAFCHGPVVVSGGTAPDLRASAVVLDDDAFGDTVRNGARRLVGMPAFGEFGAAELKALQHYIRQRAAGQ